MKINLIAAIILPFLLAGMASAETGLSLSEAIDRSLEHSYTIKSFRHDSLAAAYDLKAARLASWPNLSLNVSSFYINKLQNLT